MLGPTFINDDCGELVVRNDVGNRSEIAETLRFRFIAQRIGLHACIDLAFAQQPRAGWRPPDGFYPDILRAEPCFLRDIGNEECSSLVHGYDAHELAFEIRE